MRLVWRRIPPEEFNHELIWLAVSAAVVAAGVVWLGLGLPWLRCPFRAVTGYPCLTCGATRCTIAFLHGNLPLAWSWNPLAFCALCAVALFDVYALIVLAARAPRLRVIDWTSRETNAVRLAVIAVILANWAYLVTHHARY
jgi:hypothetical protein